MNTPITTETRLSNIYDYAMELKQQKADQTGPAQAFHFNEDGRLTVSSPNPTSLALPPWSLNERAMYQITQKLGKAYDLPSLDFNYFMALKDKAPALLAANLNGAIERLPAGGNGWLVRGYGDQCRAVLSDQYLVIDNDQMLETLNTILSDDGTPHRISNHSFVNVDNMCVDIRFKDVTTPHNDGGGNSHWGLGIRIRNGEVGDWSGGVYPMLWRSTCDNSISFDDRSMSFVFKHFGQRTLNSKKVMLKAAMGEILPFAAQLLDKMIEADGKELPTFGDIVNGLGIKHGWSEEFTQTVFAGTERRETLAGLVNGITFAAHEKAGSQEEMVDQEFLAGRLLFDERDSLTREAAVLYRNSIERENARTARAEARAERQARRFGAQR